jgi:arylsulfatase A-like enzyme
MQNVRMTIASAVFMCGIFVCPAFSQAQEQPNVILINLDDADSELMSPETMALLYPSLNRFATEGIRFTNLHVTTPLCGPSRACLLRGQYAHNTGIRTNDPFVPRSNGFGGGMRHYFERGYFENDLSTWMKAAGYRTMMVGKFLHGDVMTIVPTGWDDFYSSLGADYYGAIRFSNQFNPNGEVRLEDVTSYRTRVEAGEIDSLIRTHKTSGAEEPFFLYYAPLAPHNQGPGSPGGMVEERYLNLWPGMQQTLAPDFNEANLFDKTSVMHSVPVLNDKWLTTATTRNRDRRLAMKTVDDLVGELFDTLDELGLSDNTYVMLTSDNGYCNGHHRLFGKSDPFHRSTNVPMYVIGPNVPPGVTANHLLAHIDIAPTIIELAGNEVPAVIDGKSFMPLIFNPASTPVREWRDAVLIENWETRSLQRMDYNFGSFALRMYDSVYAEWADGTSEFYRLDSDPYQLQNVIDTIDQEQIDYFSSYLRTFRGESEKPETTISTPFENGEYMNKRMPFTGMAEDDDGISRVALVIRRMSDQFCWNGQEWQPQYVRVDAEVTNPGQQLTSWRYFNVPKVTSDEIIVIWARAYDVNGLNDPVLPWVAFQIDHSKPNSTIDSPTNGATQNSLAVSGRATDERFVTDVRLVIRNTGTGKYWSGANWVDSWTYLLLPVSANNQRWSYTNAAISGNLYISSRAVDDSGNVQATPTSINIVVSQ